MDIQRAKRIILYVVEKTKTRWSQYDEHWCDIDNVFIRRGYEQGGFEVWKFAELLKNECVLSIEKIGMVLERYRDDKRYDRKFAGSLESVFYQDMKNGKYGEEGVKFCRCIKNFKGKAGAWFWNKLWQMLVCCNYLRKNYESSFSYFLKKKYAEFKKISMVTDNDFLNMDPGEWEKFKRGAKPWKELLGIGENVFDFIVGDIAGASFVKDSYKLDSSNSYFFKVTGISELIPGPKREQVVIFLKDLCLPYTLREINKGIYTYCSETEAENFGFCRNRSKCSQCNVNDVCEKNF